MSSVTSDSGGRVCGDERMIFGHRGLSSLAPENTMAAFRCAVDHRVTWVEADVDVIADGTVIICHDSTLDRTSTPEAGSPLGSRVSRFPPWAISSTS